MSASDMDRDIVELNKRFHQLGAERGWFKKAHYQFLVNMYFYIYAIEIIYHCVLFFC